MEWQRSVDLDRLLQRVNAYAAHYGANKDVLGKVGELLRSDVARELLSLPREEWEDVLVNDLYKVTMHKMYAKFLGGVQAEFALHIRKSPIRLCALARERPDLFRELQAHVQKLTDVQPFSPAVQRALAVHAAHFTLTPDMVTRAETFRVGPCTWSSSCERGCGAPDCCANSKASAQTRVDNAPAGDGCLLWENRKSGDCACIASGPIESASHTETTVMQLVQAAIIRAQVENLKAQDTSHSTGSSAGSWPDRTELLASSLAHLASVIDALNAQDHELHISLFAGRRSSDRLYLVLQNMAFAQLVRGYQGTSSVYAATILNKVWDKLGWSDDARLQYLGPLMGTHAHEQSSILQQLLADMDSAAGQEAVGKADISTPVHPLPVSSLLAHLLFLAVNGDLAHATALPDTFGTPSFVTLSLACDVPEALIEDLRTQHGVELHSGAKVFDLFRVWRIDSGSYEDIAELILSAWETRCAQLREGAGSAAGSAGAPPDSAGISIDLPRPILMHSNLGSVEEVLQVARLPERIRPHTVAFGSLADGYFPLLAPDVSSSEAGKGQPIQMISVVMKAVQARAPKVTVTQPSALKIGDVSAGGNAEAKVESDPRLDTLEQQTIKELVTAMRSPLGPIDPTIASKYLALAYEQVAKQGFLGA